MLKNISSISLGLALTLFLFSCERAYQPVPRGDTKQSAKLEDFPKIKLERASFGLEMPNDMGNTLPLVKLNTNSLEELGVSINLMRDELVKRPVEEQKILVKVLLYLGDLRYKSITNHSDILNSGAAENFSEEELTKHSLSAFENLGGKNIYEIADYIENI